MKPCAKSSKGISAFSIAGAYIGTVVGAGFASGQETLRFFGLHGVSGLWGLALSTLLFILFGALVLELGNRLQARSHLEVINAVAGKRLASVIDIIITVALLAALTVMAAGAGAAVSKQFGWPAFGGSAAMMAVTIATVLFGIRGVVSAISAVAPFLIGGTMLVAAIVVRRYAVNLTWSAHELAAGAWWPVSAVAYVSYNLVLALAVLAPMGALGDIGSLRKGAIIGGLGLGLSALATDLAILTRAPLSAMQDLPMLFVISSVMEHAPLLFTLLLLAEIYTTAVANLYGFAARLAAPGSWAHIWIAIAAGALSLAGSVVGFAKLVKMLYSAIGCAGATVLLALAVWWGRHRFSWFRRGSL